MIALARSSSCAISSSDSAPRISDARSLSDMSRARCFKIRTYSPTLAAVGVVCISLDTRSYMAVFFPPPVTSASTVTASILRLSAYRCVIASKIMRYVGCVMYSGRTSASTAPTQRLSISMEPRTDACASRRFCRSSADLSTAIASPPCRPCAEARPEPASALHPSSAAG